MRVTIELKAWRNKEPTSKDIVKNIEAMERVIEGKGKLASDDSIHIGTKSILEGLYKELTGRYYRSNVR